MVSLISRNSYLSINGSYASRHPALHVEDSRWKFETLKTLLDYFNQETTNKDVAVLDVGGGAGHILKKASEYLKQAHKRNVEKYALDICPQILEKQKLENRDLKAFFNEDICHTSLANKSIDLALIIDVLEHIVNPIQALNEIRRISNYAIFKVPLENNLYSKFYNLAKKGKPRRESIENLGHLNVYNIRKLRDCIEKNTGEIIFSKYTNVYLYYLTAKYYKNRLSALDKIMYLCANKLFKLSPQWPSKFLSDFIVGLVKCY
jgi:ubiquinone/menaquinone biosynthesis C-methylase UbiE